MSPAKKAAGTGRAQPASRLRPPFEQKSVFWKDEVRSFKAATYRSLTLEARESWMRSPFLKDFRIFSCGHYAVAYGHRWERRNLDEGVYIYCVDGKGQYHQGSRSWSVEAGDLLYCFPRTHHAYAADPANPWTIHWMHVSGGRAEAYAGKLGFTLKNPVAAIGIHEEIIHLFASLYALFQPSRDENRLLIMRACAEHILALMGVLPRLERKPSQSYREVQSIVPFMEASLGRNLCLRDFADHLGMSVYHFCRVFKAVADFPPMEYFTQLKVRRACALLATSAYKVKVVARDLGYEDPYHFSRVFKRIMGVSPEQYRSHRYSSDSGTAFAGEASAIGRSQRA
jgi:AraC-like DNA-binding protein/quercetin dioxygenase-like cupin family protein